MNNLTKYFLIFLVFLQAIKLDLEHIPEEEEAKIELVLKFEKRKNCFKNKKKSSF